MIKVRDQHANIREGFEDEVEFENGIDVLSEDGKELFSLDLKDDGTLVVSGGEYARIGDKILGTTIQISPKASNQIEIRKNVERKALDIK